MKLTNYHNPHCSTSRGALEFIRARGIEPRIVEYLKTPLTRAEIAASVKKMNVPVRDVVRWKETLAAELKLEDARDGNCWTPWPRIQS